MDNLQRQNVGLPADQQAIQAKCFHPTGVFVRFNKEKIEESIPGRFEEMVHTFPDRIAVKALDQSLTYIQLNEAANRLSHALLGRLGLEKEPIALLLSKNVSLVIAVFGVLKAGKMYLLLDPSHPTARNRFILNHAQARLIVTDTEHLGLAGELIRSGEQLVNVIDPDATVGSGNPHVAISPDSIAWIHYTSGSTGEPKGVVQTHRNALHKVMRDTNEYHLSSSDKLVFPASRGGDMFLALLNGASVFPVEIKERGFSGLREPLKQDDITILTSVTSAFRHFVKSLAPHEYFPTIRLIRLIGEPLYKSDVDAFKKYFSKSCILLNRLGSNETGTFCQYFIDHSTPIMGAVVPVGYPTEGTEVLLLDEEGKEVSDNQVGEFAVRYRHLAVGYWRNPELTQTAFRRDPADEDRRIYRVGDLGRRLPDGCFVHLGRKDFQVKIRGNRVEIAEVEGALLSCANIREAAVVDREDASGETILAAYIVPETSPFPTANEVRRALVEKLPGYMVPTAYVMMDALPVTGTGKVDRRALPEPSDQDTPRSTKEYIQPRNTTERVLCEIWSEVLGIDRVGIDDDFFAIGGHSLLAAKLFARLDEQFGRVFPLSILLSAPTVRLLAEHSETGTGQINASTLVTLATWGTLPPIYAVPGIFGNVVGMMELSRALGHPFYSLQSRGLHGKDAPLTSIEAMANLYIDEIRKVQPHGPYVIIGACFGATVAYEMTRQILGRGDEVAFLGLIDPGRRERFRGAMNGFTGHRVVMRARAFCAFLIDRTRLYLGEMRRFEKRDRLKFIKGKLAYLLSKARSGRSFDAVQREIDQLEVYQANRFALRRYRRKPLVGGLQALEIFESSHPRNRAEGGLKWESFWHGAVVRHKVPGKDSGDMVSGENARVLAALLAERIGKAIESPVCQHEKPAITIPLQRNRFSA